MPVTNQMADCLQVARMASIRPLSSARTHCQTSSLSWKSGSSQSACPRSLLANHLQNFGLCASVPCKSICLLLLCAGVRMWYAQAGRRKISSALLLLQVF